MAVVATQGAGAGKKFDEASFSKRNFWNMEDYGWMNYSTRDPLSSACVQVGSCICEDDCDSNDGCSFGERVSKEQCFSAGASSNSVFIAEFTEESERNAVLIKCEEKGEKNQRRPIPHKENDELIGEESCWLELAVKHVKIILPSQLPKKDACHVGDIIQAWVAHVESVDEFYIIPKHNFVYGKMVESVSGPSQWELELIQRFKRINMKRSYENLPILFAGHELLERLNGYEEKMNDRRYEQYLQILVELTQYLQHYHVEYQQLAYLPGEIVAIKTGIGSQANVWMRAVVKSMTYGGNRYENIYRVQLLDYGRTEEVPWASVTTLPEQFAKHQPLAYKCKIVGARRGGSVSLKFKELLNGQSKSSKFVEISVLRNSNMSNRGWSSLLDCEPIVVDMDTLDDSGNYVCNVSFELSLGQGNSIKFHRSFHKVSWFTRVNLLLADDDDELKAKKWSANVCHRIS